MHIARTFLALAFALVGLGCSHDGDTRSHETHARRASGGERADRAPRADVDTQSHRGNADDMMEDQERLTALDQGESPEDVETTRRIRAAVMSDSSLSFDARNVVIITHEGLVTLRGDVTANEAASIERHAVDVVGMGRVQNSLRITDEDAP